MSRFAQGMKTRYAGAILNISSRYPDMYAGVIMIFCHFNEVSRQVISASAIFDISTFPQGIQTEYASAMFAI